jgi:histidyl-tRNA synthetase
VTGADGASRSSFTAYQAPKGTQDILPPESARWERLVAAFAGIAQRAGYGLAVSPLFEDVGVFRRGVGESTDIVSKEMYEFKDKGGRTLALRPEGTASIIRAFVEHRQVTPWKTWYATPCFRQESPQAGRYRQHHQLGVEIVGTDDPDADVEVIVILSTLYRTIGLRQVELRINSMGDAQCMPGYRELLVAFLEAHESELCPEHQARWRLNPLRFFDCKNAPCRALRERAPRIRDSLCEPCLAAFARVLAGLDALGVPYRRDDFLVRGFDYYTRTTFEFVSLAFAGAQDAVGGGGRYDGLVALLGGPDVSGIGFGAGIERILLACDAEGVYGVPAERLDVFVVDLTGGEVARDLSHQLRAAGFSVERAFDARSMKSQMRAADRSGAKVAVIVGTEELASGVVSLRLLRGDGPDGRASPGGGAQAGGAPGAAPGAAGEQATVPRGELVERLGEVLG